MLTPPFLFLPAAAACPPPQEEAPPPTLRPGQLALAPDGTAHMLTTDPYAVCWWSVSEEGEPELHAIWPLPGPHPVALAVAAEGEVVMAGRTDAGWAVTVIGGEGSPRDIPVGGDGQLLRLEVDPVGAYARLAWIGRDGAAAYRRVDLRTGALADLGRFVREPGRDGR